MTVKSQLVQGGDGTAIPAGFVGEVKSASLSALEQSSPTVNTYYDVTGTLSLETGEWLIVANATNSVEGAGSISGNDIPHVYLAIRSGASTLEGEKAAAGASVNGVVAVGCGCVIIPKTVAATTTFKISIVWKRYSGSSSTCTKITALLPKLFAVRIA